MFDNPNERSPNLADPKERARLSQSALKGFFNIASRWQLTTEQQRGLLAVSNEEHEALLRPISNHVLDEDKLTRISYVLGCYQALHILYSNQLADRWMISPNDNPIFGGKRPVDKMIEGGLPAMRSVRGHLDVQAQP